MQAIVAKISDVKVNPNNPRLIYLVNGIFIRIFDL